MPLEFFTPAQRPEEEQQPQMGQVEDFLRSTAAGAGRGALSIPGMVGDIGQLANQGAYWLERQARGLTPEQMDQVAQERMQNRPIQALPPTTEWPDVSTQGLVDKVGADFLQHQPQTTAGKYAKTGTEMAVGSAGVAGAIARQAPRIGRDVLASGLVPGLASEAAGQAAEGTGYEGAVRAGTAIATGAVGNVALPGRTPASIIGGAAGNPTPQQLDAAEELFTRAQGMGVPITRAQALHTVTSGATSLPDVQRVVEGQGHLRDFYAPLPGGVRESGMRTMDQSIGERPVNPGMVGPDASRAADQAINAERRDINAQTRPLYDAAAGDTVDPQTLAGWMENPVYRQTVQELRSDPTLQEHTRGLAPDSVLFNDLVQRRMQDRLDASQGQQDHLSGLRRMGVEEPQRSVHQGTADASEALRIAREQQEQLRRLYLAPLENGPLGKIRDRPETAGAVQALFPQGGVQPSPGEVSTAITRLRATGGQGEWAANQLVRTYLQSQFDQATKGGQSGPNQWGGATFNAMVRGNPAMAENLQAAITALPDGAERWQGVQRFLEVMEATGSRQRQGSATAFNQELQQRLKSGGPVEETAKVAAQVGAGFPRRIREAIEQWQMGRNTGELARLLTDPRAGARFRQLAQHDPGSPVSMRLVGSLAALGLRGSAQGSGNSLEFY